MKSKRGAYLIAAVIGTSVIFLLVAVIAFLAVTNYINAVAEYPQYSYEEYIDRTDSGLFTQDGGAQLYEAESGSTEGAAISERLRASADYCVDMTAGARLSLNIISVADCTVQLTAAVSYSSENMSDAYASDILALTVNDVTCDTGTSLIRNCYNGLQYKENILCRINLSKGGNTIVIECIGADFYIDYIVLTPSGSRMSDDETIGVTAPQFNIGGNVQLYEAERIDYDEQTVTEYDGAASGYYYTRTERGQSVNLYIDSDGEGQTMLAIRIRGDGDTQACIITVNDDEENALEFSDDTISGEYPQYTVGEVSLAEGLNCITITAVGRSFSLDALFLNADVNYSSVYSTQKYEAEDAVLSGGNVAESNSSLSNGGAVIYNSAGSTITFSITSRTGSDESELLSLRLSCFGEEDKLSDLMRITFNGEELSLDGVEAPQSSDYNDYFDVAVGEITVSAGENILVIESLSGKYGNYNLDHITLSKWSYAPNSVYEAEHAALTGGNLREYNQTASGSMDVGYNNPDSTVSFYIWSDAVRTVSLYARTSSISQEDVYMSTCFSVKINDADLNIYGRMLRGNGAWTSFSYNYVGEITLAEGLNVIIITSCSLLYNLDCLVIY